MRENKNKIEKSISKHIINNLKVAEKQLRKSDPDLECWKNEIIWIRDAIRCLEEIKGEK